MSNTDTLSTAGTFISTQQMLDHWQGHRRLTRKLIESFPEKDFFSFSIGGMRTCAALVQELLAIAAPGLRQIATGEDAVLEERIDFQNSKKRVLELWDEATADLDRYWKMIPEKQFSENIVTFGQYPGTVWSSILYFIDNEIHHRAQAYVYLRALGAEPPMFWER